jgi:murein DD-endopeptidase MepM/ murein hydrolase activator NlpD
LTSKRYSLVVADRSTGVVHRFTISLWPTLAGVAFVLALPILMGLGARWSARSTIGELELTSALLQVENASYREATSQLTAQVSSLQAAVDELGAKAAVDPAVARAMEKLPANVKARAMGGTSAIGLAAPLLGNAIGSPDSPFGVLRDLLGSIEERLNSMRSGVERQRALASATPSIWPVAGWLSSSYGKRLDPFGGGEDFHPGLDISADYGLPVLATADGVVAGAGPSGNYGNMVTLEHGFGIVTRYGHLSRFNVVAGQRVHRRDVIGYVGSTGRSTSPHLHYETLVTGKLTNPLKFLSGE